MILRIIFSERMPLKTFPDRNLKLSPPSIRDGVGHSYHNNNSIVPCFKGQGDWKQYPRLDSVITLLERPPTFSKDLLQNSFVFSDRLTDSIVTYNNKLHHDAG